MSSFTKAEGAKIIVRFTENLIGDVSGLTPVPVGGISTNVKVSHLNKPTQIGQVYTANTTYSTNVSSLAFDGSTSTYWETRTALPQWIQCALLEPKAVNKFRYYSGASYRIRAYKLEASNDLSNWTELWSGENANATGWNEYTFVNTTAYKYYRWTVTSLWTAGRIYVYELELYADIPIGNEQAFTVTAQEPQWVEFPSEELGSLTNSTIQIKSVEAYPSTPNQIILNTYELTRFNNVEGLITVSYNATNGNLQGAGGIVQSFIQSATPTDLVRVPNPLFDENIHADIVNYSITLSPIIDIVVGDGNFPTNNSNFNEAVTYDWEAENINVTIANYTIVLTHIDDLNP